MKCRSIHSGLSWRNSCLKFFGTIFQQQTVSWIHIGAQPFLDVKPTYFSSLKTHQTSIIGKCTTFQSLTVYLFLRLFTDQFDCLSLHVASISVVFGRNTKKPMLPADTQLRLCSCINSGGPLLTSISWGPGLIFNVEVPHLKSSR